MRKLFIVTAAAAAFVAVPALAQDSGTSESAPESSVSRFEPYVGVMGGWEQFDNERNAGIPQSPDRRDRLDGSLVQGVAGVNIGLVGPLFVGVEGNAAKGIKGDIDWEYGVAGRAGFRAGDSGMFYGKVGYQWVNFDHFSGRSTNGGDTGRDYSAITYGIGAEVGPQNIGLKGITGNAGFRIRAEVNTFGDAQSFRPMLGIITHF